MAFAPSVSVKVEGLKELDDLLHALDKKAARRALAAAARKTGKVWEEEARRRAPARVGTFRRKIGGHTVNVKGGALRRSITSTVKVDMARGKVSVVTGPRRLKGEGRQGPGTYGLIVEFGASHAAPQPYLAPAFDATRERIVGAFKDHLAAEIDREIKR